MPPLCGALPVQYVPVRVTHGAVIAYRYTYVPLRCRTSRYRMTFILHKTFIITFINNTYFYYSFISISEERSW